MILTFIWTSVNPGARALFIFKMPDYLRIAIDFKFLCEAVNRPLPKGFADYKVFQVAAMIERSVDKNARVCS